VFVDSVVESYVGNTETHFTCRRCVQWRTGDSWISPSHLNETNSSWRNLVVTAVQ